MDSDLRLAILSEGSAGLKSLLVAYNGLEEQLLAIAEAASRLLASELGLRLFFEGGKLRMYPGFVGQELSDQVLRCLTESHVPRRIMDVSTPPDWQVILNLASETDENPGGFSTVAPGWCVEDAILTAAVDMSVSNGWDSCVGPGVVLDVIDVEGPAGARPPYDDTLTFPGDPVKALRYPNEHLIHLLDES